MQELTEVLKLAFSYIKFKSTKIGAFKIKMEVHHR